MQNEGTREFVCRLLVCPDHVAEQLLARSALRSYPERSTILRQGDPLAHCYLVILGRARALLCTPGGQLVLLHEYQRGDIFGALGELDDVRQDADVVAIDDVVTLVIQAAHLARLAQQHGSIGLALSRLLLQRLRKATERLFERSGLSSVGRVYAELLRQARLRPDLAISPPPVLADLAVLAATTRETASRAVSMLERRGIVRRDGDVLVIVASRRLEEMIL